MLFAFYAFFNFEVLIFREECFYLLFAIYLFKFFILQSDLNKLFVKKIRKGKIIFYFLFMILFMSFQSLI